MNTKTLYQNANKYKLDKKYDLAIESFKKLIDNESHNANKENTMIYLNEIGICHFNNSNYEESLKYFKKILEFHRSLTDVYNNISNSYFHLRQYKNAEINLLISLKLKHDPEIYDQLEETSKNIIKSIMLMMTQQKIVAMGKQVL